MCTSRVLEQMWHCQAGVYLGFGYVLTQRFLLKHFEERKIG